MNQPYTVAIVDDDPDIGQAVGMLLEHEGYRVQVYTHPLEFLKRVRENRVPHCALLDLKMPRMSGLDLQEALHELGVSLPVIFLTGQGDIPSATTGMKQGAVDFLEKGVDPTRLLQSVREAIKRSEELIEEQRKITNLQHCFDRLTPREREVVAYLACGKTAKEIGRALAISPRTAEIHRSRIMEKLGVTSIADVVALAIDYGIR